MESTFTSTLVTFTLLWFLPSWSSSVLGRFCAVDLSSAALFRRRMLENNALLLISYKDVPIRRQMEIFVYIFIFTTSNPCEFYHNWSCVASCDHVVSMKSVH